MTGDDSLKLMLEFFQQGGLEGRQPFQHTGAKLVGLVIVELSKRQAINQDLEYGHGQPHRRRRQAGVDLSGYAAGSQVNLRPKFVLVSTECSGLHPNRLVTIEAACAEWTLR